jgi:hypothetical protein
MENAEIRIENAAGRIGTLIVYLRADFPHDV